MLAEECKAGPKKTGPKIKLYVDIVSPFAYMAYYTLRNSPTFKPCEIEYIPIYLGGIMKETGNTPPISIKNKHEWINIERVRWATHFSIPIGPTPANFPVNTIQIQRILTAIRLDSPADLTAAISAFYDAYWVRGNTPDCTKGGAQAVLESVLGPEQARKILAEAQGDDAKKRLSEETGKAVEEGAFGLPYFVATNEQGETEKFWGFDHLGQVVRFLGLDRDVGNEGWKAML